MTEQKWKSAELVIWKPTPEQPSIEGVLINKKEHVGKYGSRGYIIENAEGLFLVFGTKILDDQMEYCMIGKKVKIIYKGVKRNKNDTKDIKMYAVERGEE